MNTARHLGLAVAMLIAAPLAQVQAQDRTADPLHGITRCIDSGEFHAASKDRLPAGVTSRTVETATGAQQVSLADGYRMMIYRTSKAPLVNLKIERSAPGRFDADRAAILLQLDGMASRAKTVPPLQVEREDRGAIEVHSLSNRGVAESGIGSMIDLFDGASGTIATVYVLNQAPAVREYADEAAYRQLRERFVEAVSRCMAHPSN